MQDDRGEEAEGADHARARRASRPSCSRPARRRRSRESQKITRKRTRNQDQSTVIRIPRTWNRVIGLPPSMAQWYGGGRPSDASSRIDVPPTERRSGLAARAGSRSSSRSIGPRPPKASGRPRSGSSSASGSWAPRRGSRRSRARHLLVAARDRRRAGRARRGSPACAGAACSAPLLGAIGAAGIADDFPPGKRPLRRPLPKRTTYNVVCELGPADAERTMVVVAHHDAAHSGLDLPPRAPQVRRPPRADRGQDTSPPLMAPVVGGPMLAALGALTGRRLLSKLGILLGARLGRGDGRHRLAQGRTRRQRQRHRASSPCWRWPSGWSRSRPRTCG